MNDDTPLGSQDRPAPDASVEDAFRGHDRMDREGLDRWRQLAREKPGHEFAALNWNSVRRLIGTIDSLASRPASDGWVLAVRKVLREHWLTALECDPEARTDTTACFCSVWRSEPQPSIIAAVEAWIDHVVSHLAASPSALSGEGVE